MAMSFYFLFLSNNLQYFPAASHLKSQKLFYVR